MDQQFIDAVNNDPAGNACLVYADWLDESGRDAEAKAWALGLVSWVCRRGIGSGRGIGIGRGSGSGSGIGIGRGSGSGIGRGSGIGIGSGSGIGIGRGSGIGIGSGSGSGIGIGNFARWEMKIGKNYLLHCGDWHSYVGRCVGQSGPLVWEFEQVSKIHDTNNGDNWEKLAAGDESLRKSCDYRHYTTPVFIPLSIAAFEWVGKLPQEAD